MLHAAASSWLSCETSRRADQRDPDISTLAPNSRVTISESRTAPRIVLHYTPSSAPLPLFPLFPRDL